MSTTVGETGADYLAVTQHGLLDEMRRCFAEMTPLTTIAIVSGPGGGRTYAVYIARDFLGPGQGAVGAECRRY